MTEKPKAKESKSRTKVKSKRSKPKPSEILPSELESVEEVHKSEVIEQKADEPEDERDKEDAARLEQLLAASRVRKQSFWETVCYDIEAEFGEIDLILTKLGLRPYNYRKDKVYMLPLPFKQEELNPNMEQYISRDFLEFHVFPTLLPGIESMILYATKNGVFQCQAGLFNPLDYIVEYLYNNNPLYPHRKANMIPLPEIPFAASWLLKYPREPYPKWLSMSEDEAALVIQRSLRRMIAKKKGKGLEEPASSSVSILEAESKEFQKPKYEEVCGEGYVKPVRLYGPYTAEMSGEDDLGTHSYHCLLCNKYKSFIQQEKYRTHSSQALAGEDVGEDDTLMLTY